MGHQVIYQLADFLARLRRNWIQWGLPLPMQGEVVLSYPKVSFDANRTNVQIPLALVPPEPNFDSSCYSRVIRSSPNLAATSSSPPSART
jgi:hypothetical protein